MNKQDKLFDLLKRNGWERAKTSEGVGYRFKTLNREEYNALSDKYEALGWCEALEIPCGKLWVMKEGDLYATYLEFYNREGYSERNSADKQTY